MKIVFLYVFYKKSHANFTFMKHLCLSLFNDLVFYIVTKSELNPMQIDLLLIKKKNIISLKYLQCTLNTPFQTKKVLKTLIF